MKYHELTNFDYIKEMSNLRLTETGIDDVVIYIGPPSKKHGHRVKISNISNGFSDDNFTITIPDLRIIGIPDKRIRKKLKLIFRFIEINQKNIIDYSGKIIQFDKFLINLKKVDE